MTEQNKQAAKMDAPPAQWTELAAQWQDLGGRWARWWQQLATAAQPAGMAAPGVGNAGLSLPAFPAAHIDPLAAAALTDQYNRKFEALWLQALQGAPAPTPGEHRDRRFASKEWREQPYFTLLKEAYLLYSEYLHQLVELAQGEAAEQKRLAFLVDQYVDAIAPSNFLATNPDALKLALDSGGASLAQGLTNLAADAQRGRISMTDETAFAVGVNLAITPGSVVFRNELVELIQYAPRTKTVFKRPLLIVPPCINKYYILDLQPENSFVRYAVEQGHTVFMVSWRNIGSAQGTLGWDDYLQDGVLTVIDRVRDIAASSTLNVLGFCVGGTLLASALAVLAARRIHHASSATFLTTMLDFSDPGDIGVYVAREALAAREPALRGGGRVKGSELANAFASLRANDLVWNYVVGNYLKGQTPPAFDLLYWNSDSANLPGPMYVDYVRNMYLDNRLCEPDALTMCDEAIDLGRINVPAYVYASRDDHIVPWRSAYRTVKLLGGEPVFILGASGHIAGVINPAAKNRRNYWSNELLTEDADDWLERAESIAGSWWPHWAAWLAGYAGARHPAPRAAGNARNRPLCPAPGTYVTEIPD
ncbi:MAG: class I poly(R)-hydroxyalkanoic acid synthase [Casimicrobiaceae bacterium]